MGFLFLPVMPMGLRWAALRAAGAPLSNIYTAEPNAHGHTAVDVSSLTYIVLKSTAYHTGIFITDVSSSRNSAKLVAKDHRNL